MISHDLQEQLLVLVFILVLYGSFIIGYLLIKRYNDRKDKEWTQKVADEHVKKIRMLRDRYPGKDIGEAEAQYMKELLAH